jgi:hypothetical protein
MKGKKKENQEHETHRKGIVGMQNAKGGCGKHTKHEGKVEQ